MDSSLFLCFKGVDIPDSEEDRLNDIISCRVFLKLLAKSDNLFGMLWEDHKDTILSTKTPQQSVKNWRCLSAVLDDHGLEISPEVMFSIISGQETTAVQLANEIRSICDQTSDRQAVRRVGPAVPIRQRVNPFLGTMVTPGTASQSHSKALLTAQSVNPTRLYVQDPSRFMRKRTLFVEQLEKLKEKEARQQRLKEKKEREAQQRLIEQQKRSEMQDQQKAQEQFINETLLLHRADPEKVAQKKRRTELLSQLEVLESAFTQDQKRLIKLRSRTGGSSPRREERPTSNSPVKRPATPQRLRAATSIPFSKLPSSSKKSSSRKQWQ